MGQVFGAIDVETPAHVTLQKYDTFEVRRYPEGVAASVSMGNQNETNDSFRILARYIGVFGNPANEKASPIAMTAPVITERGGETIAMTAPVMVSSGAGEKKGPEAIAMTAPVLMTPPSNTNKEMSFILPSQFTMENAPTPTNSRVKIHRLPPRTVAVSSFSWLARPEVQEEKAKELIESVENLGLRTSGRWSCAQYNPPFCVPFLRTNEIHLEIIEEKGGDEKKDEGSN